jgi:hypothetical protein
MEPLPERIEYYAKAIRGRDTAPPSKNYPSYVLAKAIIPAIDAEIIEYGLREPLEARQLEAERDALARQLDHIRQIVGWARECLEGEPEVEAAKIWLDRLAKGLSH